MTLERTNWAQVALIFVLGLGAAAQFGKVSLILPDLAIAYDTSAARVAILVSLVGLIGVLFGVVAGDLVARIGPRRALLWAVALGGGLSLIQASLPALPVLIALRLFEGVSHLAIVVAAPPLMAAAANDRDRPIAMSLWAMFFGVSFAGASLLFPALLSIGGPGLVFAVHGAVLWCIGLILSRMLPRLPLNKRLNSHARTPLGAYLGAHVTGYRRARLSAPGLGFVFYTMLYIALLTFLPRMVPVAGLGQSLPLISLAGTFAAGWLARRWRPDLLAAFGFVASILCALFLFSNATWPLYPLFFMLGVIPGACFAAIAHFNQSLEDRARASGVLAQMGNVGTTTGTPIMAMILSWGGMPALWGGVIIACLLGLALIWFSAVRIRQQG